MNTNAQAIYIQHSLNWCITKPQTQSTRNEHYAVFS